jgi:hypothetical protein
MQELPRTHVPSNKLPLAIQKLLGIENGVDLDADGMPRPAAWQYQVAEARGHCRCHVAKQCRSLCKSHKCNLCCLPRVGERCPSRRGHSPYAIDCRGRLREAIAERDADELDVPAYVFSEFPLSDSRLRADMLIAPASGDKLLIIECDSAVHDLRPMAYGGLSPAQAFARIGEYEARKAHWATRAATLFGVHVEVVRLTERDSTPQLLKWQLHCALARLFGDLEPDRPQDMVPLRRSSRCHTL